jgi:hypothetical protein
MTTHVYDGKPMNLAPGDVVAFPYGRDFWIETPVTAEWIEQHQPVVRVKNTVEGMRRQCLEERLMSIEARLAALEGKS